MSLNNQHILLHCCCAPCTVMPLQSLVDEGWQVALYYYNPNIHPREEYELRLGTLQEYAEANSLQLSVGTYDPEAWEERVGIYGGPFPLIYGASEYAVMEEARKKRCRACYQMRFENLATYGKATGQDYLDATLSISPYQFTDEVIRALKENVAELGMTALGTDWRTLYPEATQKSRALGMYRQNYCGCRFSKQEAELERKARKEARKKARTTKV